MGRKRSGLEHNAFPSLLVPSFSYRPGALSWGAQNGREGAGVPRCAQTPALPCSVHTAAPLPRCVQFLRVSVRSLRRSRADRMGMYTCIHFSMYMIRNIRE